MYDKIFVIGFNKTATRSLHNLFVKNNLTSQHTGSHWDLDSYQCFSDNGNFKNFKDLDEKYPNSIFILNTRKLNKWVISRFKHGLKVSLITNKPNNWAWPYSNELATVWINQREEFYFDILEYFKDRPDKLIIASIEKPDWIPFVANQINLQNVVFPHQNVNKLTNQHDNIIDCVNQTFNTLNYDDVEKETVLFRDAEMTNKYTEIYINNIK